MINPWPGARVNLSSDKKAGITGASVSGNLLKFSTQPGETIVLIPQNP